MAFEIAVEEFRGPFELLFELIEKEQIDIYNIPIHHITEQFILRMNEVRIPSDEISDFILFASMLLEVKSRMLLPDAKLESMDETSEDDPRQGLLLRLLEYKKIRQMDQFLTNRERRYLHQISSDDMVIKLPDLQKKSLDLPADLLKQAFEELLKRRGAFLETREEEFFRDLQRESFSVSKMQTHLSEVLQTRASLDFFELFEPLAPKSKWIATFLALLKLQQEGAIRVIQEDAFSALSIVRNNE